VTGERPAIVRFVEDVHRGRVPGAEGRPSLPDVRRLGLAATAARAHYPGLAGELIAREAWAYSDVGHRFGTDAVVPRTIADLLVDHGGPAPSGP